MPRLLPVLYANFQYEELHAEDRFRKPKRRILTGTFGDYQNGVIEEPSGGACHGKGKDLVPGKMLVFGSEENLQLTIQKQLTEWATR